MVNDAVSGGLAAITSCILLQPLEVYKTRLQEHAKLPKNMFHFWRGTTVTLIRNVPGVALYFTCLQHFRYLLLIHHKRTKYDWLVDPNGHRFTTAGNLLTGGGARIVAGFLLMPLTVIKTMFESAKFEGVHGGMSEMTKRVYEKQGIRGLFKGFSVTCLRDAPHAAIYVAVYEHTKTQISADSIPGYALAGISAGSVATLVTQPFDTVKTAIQLDKYSSTFEAFKDIMKGQGIRGFYTGTMPRFMRKTLSSAITWTVYECLSRL